MVYGAPVIVTAVIANGSGSIDYILVGDYLGLAALGYYVIAFRLPELIIQQTLANVHTVLFPYYSRVREQGSRLDAKYLTTLRIASLVVVPIPTTLCALSLPIIVVVFGEKWEPAAGVMPGIALGMTFLVIGGIPGDLFKAKGRPWIQLILASCHLALWFPGIVLLAPHGIDAIAWLYALLAGLLGLGSWAFAIKVLDQSWREQFGAIAPAILAGCSAGLLARLATEPLDPLPALLVGVPVLWLSYGVGVIAFDASLRALALRLVRRSGRAAPSPGPARP
jgi:PST family polysaccharide transporter